MKNIYDIRKEEELLYILESSGTLQSSAASQKREYGKCAVIVNLYYEETVLKYAQYMNRIPEEIPIYVFSPNAFVLKLVRENCEEKDVICEKKENRGRDISAMLVAAKKVVHQYDFVCFLHDKSANAEYLTEDVDFWIENLWENMLSSEKYINNILNIFDEKQDIGLLVPPEPYGEYNSHWYGDTWYEDYDNTLKLAKTLDIEADIKRDKPVFTLGTVFWARTKALGKLIDYPWKYEDFPQEPLAVDGTISHAIERIIGYVVQGAGYKTGTVMTSTYASKLLLRVQEDMREMFSRLVNGEHIFNIHQVLDLEVRERKIEEFCEKYEQIYIYGCGNYGKNLAKFITDRKWKIDGFVVSTGQRDSDYENDLKVHEIQEIDCDRNVGVIIGVSYEYREEIEKILREYNFHNYIYGY